MEENAQAGWEHVPREAGVEQVLEGAVTHSPRPGGLCPQRARGRMEGPAESRTPAPVLRLAHVPSWHGKYFGENVIHKVRDHFQWP